MTYSPGESLDGFLTSLPAATTPAGRGRAGRQRLHRRRARAGRGALPARPGAADRRQRRLRRRRPTPASPTDRPAGRWWPTPTSGSSPGAVDELLAVAARWPRAATVGPAIRTPDGRALPLGPRPARRCRPASGTRCSAGCGRPTRGPRATAASARRRASGRPAGCRAPASSSTSRRSTPSAASTPATSCTSRTSTSPPGSADRGWLHVYAPSAVVEHEGGHATRRDPHRMQRVHHTSALRYLSAPLPAAAAHAPLRAALRAGLGGRMLRLLRQRPGRRRARSRSGRPSELPRRRRRPGAGDRRPPIERTPRAPRSDHGRRLRHAAVAAVPGRAPQAAARRHHRRRTAARTACSAEAFDRLRAVLPADRIWVCTAARYGDMVRAALPELRRRPADPRAGRAGHRERRRADRGAGGRRRPGRRAGRGQRRPRHPPGRAVRRDAARPPTTPSPSGPTRWSRSASRRPRRRPASATCSAARRPRCPASSEAAAFREKPDRATAEAYLASGEYLWNSGMFVWRAQTVLDALADHLPGDRRRGCARIVAARAGPRAGRRPRRGLPDAAEDQRRLRGARAGRDRAGPGAGRRPRRRLAGRRLVAGAGAHPRRRRRGQRRPRAHRRPRRLGQHRAQRRPRRTSSRWSASATAWWCTPPTSRWSAPSPTPSGSSSCSPRSRSGTASGTAERGWLACRA